MMVAVNKAIDKVLVGGDIMMYPYMTLNDNTEITHSEMKTDGRVKVYIETPDEKVCFRHATCWLPEYKWENGTFDYGVLTGGRI